MTQDIDLSKLTTFRIGGTPSWYARPKNYQELEKALEECASRELPYRVLGGGSNLLVDDGDLPFAVIHICAPAFSWIRPCSQNDGTLRVGAGTRITQLLRESRDLGLGGLEFMAGIPGTVGGAVTGNAGAWGNCIGDMISRLWSWDETGGRHEITADDLNFSYRSASIPADIVTEVELQLTPRNTDLVGRQIQQNLDKKRSGQPTSAPNAGCVFRNPEDTSAGRMLDRCGLKGSTIGGAAVSQQHANFICNEENASSEEVLELIETMRRKVRTQFGIDLELELQHWPADHKVA